MLKGTMDQLLMTMEYIALNGILPHTHTPTHIPEQKLH